jgi:hypothetical protein
LGGEGVMRMVLVSLVPLPLSCLRQIS